MAGAFTKRSVAFSLAGSGFLAALMHFGSVHSDSSIVLYKDVLLASHFLQSEETVDLSVDEWLLFLHTFFDKLANAFWL